MLTLNQVMKIYGIGGELQQALLEADLPDDAQKVATLVMDLMEKDLSEAATRPEHVKLVQELKDFRRVVERMMGMHPDEQPEEGSEWPAIIIGNPNDKETH